MENEILHFTLGPVQGFIADARRTRDLWAGSFLLSWLSGQAMAALKEKGGSIIFPKVEDDDLFKALSAARSGGSVANTPFIGSLPNRFKADVSRVEGNAGEICKTAVSCAWKRLTAAVYGQFIDKDIEKLGVNTRGIWNRQVDNFWDMMWVVGEDREGGDNAKWLDQRKNWQSHYNGKDGEEPNDLCRLMGEYQELSGYDRLSEKTKQSAFWTALSKTAGISPLDLKADERLCAIALVKRLFPRLDNIAKVIDWKPGDNAEMDIVHWPSVSYIAALPWLKAAEKLKNEQQSKYWKNAEDNLTSEFMGESANRLFGLPKNGLFKLDGHLLHQDAIAAWPDEDLKDVDGDHGKNSRRNLLEGLAEVEKAVGARASEFYAVLLMDGDSIGTRLVKCPDIVRDGLALFTNFVKTYFARPNQSNGVLIYAGGDDVLALVPVDTAIQAGQDLREGYIAAFKKTVLEAGSNKSAAQISDFTISAAVIFAQYKIPFRRVLSHAHHYLDDIAKDQNGRNSLAIAVAKPGGIPFDWVSVWEHEGIAPVETLKNLAIELNVKQHISSSLFYNLTNRYKPLFAPDREDEGSPQSAEIFGDVKLIRALIEAELSHSGKNDFKVSDVAGQLIVIGKPLAQKGTTVAQCDGYQFDSGLIVRFLSVEGRWKLQGGGT